MSAYIDTHIAVWLYAGDIERLSAAAKKGIETNDLLISPIVLLELDYLYRRKRIAVEATDVYRYLASTFGILLCEYPFAGVVFESLALGWTSDPFDRLIVAQAAANDGAPLVTADRLIRRHYKRAVW